MVEKAVPPVVSCSSYAMGVALTPPIAAQILTAAVQDETREPPVRAVLTLRRLARMLPELELRLDTGATHIGKSRSRHLAHALERKAPLWVTVDDDVDASDATLGTLLSAFDDDEPRVVFAPCLLRSNPEIAAVEFSSIHVVRKVNSIRYGSGEVRRALAGGFGLVAANLAAMKVAAQLSPAFYDDDGRMKPAAFLETLAGSPQGLRWLGEDIAFFRRICENCLIEAVVTGTINHAGAELDLAQLRDAV